MVLLLLHGAQVVLLLDCEILGEGCPCFELDEALEAVSKSTIVHRSAKVHPTCCGCIRCHEATHSKNYSGKCGCIAVASVHVVLCRQASHSRAQGLTKRCVVLGTGDVTVDQVAKFEVATELVRART